MMKAFLLFLAFLIKAAQGQNLCSSVPRLWSCVNNKAIFNAIEAKKVFNAVVPGFNPSFNVAFTLSENIEEVDITSAELYSISSISGPQLKLLKASGPKAIPSLCLFLETKMKLPAFEKVILRNAIIHGFLGNQDCGNNDLAVPLVPLDQIPNSVEILIENSFIKVDSPHGSLILERLYNLKSLTLRNVTIEGVDRIACFRNANKGKKLFAEQLYFASNPHCECFTEANSNEVKCDEYCSINDEAEPESSSGMPKFASMLCVLILQLAYQLAK